MSSEITDCVRRSLNRYFRDLDGQAPHAIYGMVIKTVELAMLESLVGRWPPFYVNPDGQSGMY